MNLFGIPVWTSPNMPEGEVYVLATCARCGHLTAFHHAQFGCSDCIDWPEDLRCGGEALDGGTPVVLVRDLDTLNTAAPAVA